MIIKKGEILNGLKLITLFSCILFLFLTGCNKEKERTRKEPVKTPGVKKEVAKVVIKEAKVDNVINYIYDAEGKRDPFKSFIQKQKIKTVKRPDVPLTPLQKYDISQLKLIGIISERADKAENRAMVTDPTGKGYILKKGTLIGRNFGRISRIEREAVIITEDIQDFLGNIITKEIPLTLETEGGE